MRSLESSSVCASEIFVVVLMMALELKKGGSDLVREAIVDDLWGDAESLRLSDRVQCYLEIWYFYEGLTCWKNEIVKRILF